MSHGATGAERILMITSYALRIWLSKKNEAYKAFPEPNACAICDAPKIHHGNVYTSAGGFHLWEPPTQKMIVSRMKVRASLKK